MTLDDLHMSEEQIVNEILFMRKFDKYLQKELGDEEYTKLSLGFARILVREELESLGATEEEIDNACLFADMMAIADREMAAQDEHAASEIQTGLCATCHRSDCPQKDEHIDVCSGYISE